MQTHALVAVVTILALLLYFYMGLRVGMARSTFNVPAPAITGHPDFERLFRVQANTLEWLPIFLPSLWLCAIFLDEKIAAGVGAVWIIGRVLYMTGYSREASARSAGFAIQALAAAVLMFGALYRVVMVLIAGGA